jgi:predicted N-acyltransferase
LAELECQLFAKYGMSHWRADLSERVLRRIHTVLGEDAFVSLARADGEICGFALILRFRNAWFAHRAGFDYSYQQKLPLYYETVFYRLVEAAGNEGIETIHYGAGSTEAKLSRGCLSATQRCYLRVLDR